MERESQLRVKTKGHKKVLKKLVNNLSQLVLWNATKHVVKLKMMVPILVVMKARKQKGESIEG